LWVAFARRGPGFLGMGPSFTTWFRHAATSCGSKNGIARYFLLIRASKTSLAFPSSTMGLIGARLDVDFVELLLPEADECGQLVGR